MLKHHIAKNVQVNFDRNHWNPEIKATKNIPATRGSEGHITFILATMNWGWQLGLRQWFQPKVRTAQRSQSIHESWSVISSDRNPGRTDLSSPNSEMWLWSWRAFSDPKKGLAQCRSRTLHHSGILQPTTEWQLPCLCPRDRGRYLRNVMAVGTCCNCMAYIGGWPGGVLYVAASPQA